MPNKSNIIIVDQKKLERIKRAISHSGSENLHIISDFDRTLTHAFVDGEKVPSMISILRSDDSYLVPGYAEKARKLFEKYHPIEINPSVSLKDKKKAMREWWMIHFDLLIESKLNKKDIERAVKSEKIKFREGALDFLDFLHDHNIPLVVMSSNGLGG